MLSEGCEKIKITQTYLWREPSNFHRHGLCSANGASFGCEKKQDLWPQNYPHIFFWTCQIGSHTCLLMVEPSHLSLSRGERMWQQVKDMKVGLTGRESEQKHLGRGKWEGWVLAAGPSFWVFRMLCSGAGGRWWNQELCFFGSSPLYW